MILRFGSQDEGGIVCNQKAPTAVTLRQTIPGAVRQGLEGFADKIVPEFDWFPTLLTPVLYGFAQSHVADALLGSNSEKTDAKAPNLNLCQVVVRVNLTNETWSLLQVHRESVQAVALCCFALR